MSDPLPYLLAFIVATLIAYLELETSLYPHTRFLIKNYRLIGYYLIFYGFIGVVFYWLIVFTGVNVIISDKIVDNLYIQAILVGAVSKGISDWNFITIPIGVNAKPIGFKTIVEPMQKELLSRLDEEESNSLREYVTSPRICCKDSKDALDKIKISLPANSRKGEKLAYVVDVEELMDSQDTDEKKTPEIDPENAAKIDAAKKNSSFREVSQRFW
jgi:hypothetical protein